MKINLMGAFNSTSYGGVLTNIAKTLIEEGHHPSFFPAMPTQNVIEQQSQENYLSTWNTIAQNMPDLSAPSLKIWHQNDLAVRPGKGTMAGFSFFELNKLSEVEQLHMQAQDVMFVASEWAKNICIEYNIKNAVVANLGVDSQIFRPQEHLKEELRKQIGLQDQYVFYMGGKFEIRKGHDKILDIFQKAFPNETDVLLLVNSWSPNMTPEENNVWANMLEQDNRVRVIKQRFASQNDIANILTCIDCAVFPSRAEGWNLPALECLAMHKPVILNNYSAHTEYSEYCTAIEPIGMQKAYDGIWFHGQGEWSQIDEDGFVEAMRNNYKNWVQSNPNSVSEKFSWKNTVSKIIKTLLELG